jgi:hypothetical protein
MMFRAWRWWGQPFGTVAVAGALLLTAASEPLTSRGEPTGAIAAPAALDVRLVGAWYSPGDNHSTLHLLRPDGHYGALHRRARWATTVDHLLLTFEGVEVSLPYRLEGADVLILGTTRFVRHSLADADENLWEALVRRSIADAEEKLRDAPRD